MPAFTFDDDWFIRERHCLLKAYASGHSRPQHTMYHMLHAEPRFDEHVDRALRHLPPRQAGALRGHMQFYRAALLATGLLPADALVKVAVQVEWFWYNVALVSAYRDHLAHMMKVATMALFLLQDERSPLAASDGSPRIDLVAERLARNDYGSAAIRGAARRCGITEERLRSSTFWREAVLETIRLAGLLHDMAHPVVLTRRMASIAGPARPQAPFEPTQEELARHSVVTFSHCLVATPFNRGQLPGPNGLASDDANACAQFFLRGHSLPAAYAILRLADQANRIWQLSPFDAFVLEWAALAVALHQGDEICYLPNDDTFSRWLEVPGNREALVPRFNRDPVSYLLGLCDTLQDFGRIQGSDSTHSIDVDHIENRVRFPCRAVELSVKQQNRRAHAVFELGPDNHTCFGATELDFKRIRAHKERDSQALFGTTPWFDHGDLFEQLVLEVRWPSEPSSASSPEPTVQPSTEVYDVFISYNRTDVTQVRGIVRQLREMRLRPWFDRDEVVAGERWIPAIEAQLETVRAAAVFYGGSGASPWQQEEVSALLIRLKERGCPVIPVLMAGSSAKPKLPPFLASYNWVDFQHDEDPIGKLVRGITEAGAQRIN